jgi:hypothetical protein
MTWTYNGLPVLELPQDCVGFVYLITNIQTNRKYIGKKLATHKKQVSQKTVTYGLGMKKIKRKYAQVPSDWQNYYGSSDALCNDITQIGRGWFRREILHYCQTKSQINYLEAREQFDRRVLETDEYYNGHIQVRVHGSHILGK